ncbi:MAG: GGDEF domain-containing protein [Pirellulaceae bacterium]|jgi:diguanylate cyclase (GGDEF)-like protein|nr:GGDEF domain-containing protein [Pirellulaceae bacterium]
MDWVVGIVVQCFVLGLIGWFLARRNDSAIRNALTVQKPEQDKGLDSAQVCNLLATAGKTLSDHSEKLGSFERSLQFANDPQCDFPALGGIRRANQCAEQAIETTIAGLVAACDDLLSEEHSSLEAFQETTIAIDTAREGIKHGELLVHIACTLLDMNRELRTEHKTVQNEVAAGKDQIIHLLSRASSAEQLARVDTLTELPNRRALEEAFTQCEKVQDQNGQPFSLILLDIDHFKAVNDTFGHAAGDALLVLVARILRENCKTADFACRVGGEEFAVLLPRCAEQPAKFVAERYRHEIESASLHYGDREIAITVSCGVAQAIPGKPQANLLKRADTALYTAKTRGRNQTCVHGDLAESQEPSVPKMAP